VVALFGCPDIASGSSQYGGAVASTVKTRQHRPAVLKKLFALSRNRCAFPVCEAALSKPEWPEVLAEVCHIYGLNGGSARHDPRMTTAELNDYPNLLLMCPTHHKLIDRLEPERWSPEELLDMKRGHEWRRPGDRERCSDKRAEQFVVQLVRTHRLILLAPGEQHREPIRSGTPMPGAPVSPEERQRRAADRVRELQSQRPHWARTDDRGVDWPRGKRRVRDLAAELGITQRAVLELCESLGISARTKDTSLSEPYADMVRRRARRDGLAQREQYPA